MSDWKFTAALIALVVAICVPFYISYRHFENGCAQRGGHVASAYKGSLCLTSDGRVITTWP